MKLHCQPFKLVSLNHRCHLSGELLQRISMADPSSSHNKSHRALSLTLNPSSVSLSSRPELSLNPCSFISKTLSNELCGRPSQAHPFTSMSPPQMASPHQTLTKPELPLSNLLNPFRSSLSRTSKVTLSSHQPPPLHGGSSALCIST